MDIITPPKTAKSKRIIDCPKFVPDMIQNFIQMFYINLLQKLDYLRDLQSINLKMI